MIDDEQQDQGPLSDPDRDTLPPEEPSPCWQQELRSAVAGGMAAVGDILSDLSSLEGHVSDLGRNLLRVGKAAERAITEFEKLMEKLMNKEPPGGQ